MRPSARANKPFGYKAVIVHQMHQVHGVRERTEVLARTFQLSEDGRDMIQSKAGHNFPTREAAIAYATRVIAHWNATRSKGT